MEMDDAARTGYLEEAVRRFGETVARVFGLAPDEALDRARSHIAEILPEGGATKLHHFRHIARESGVVGEVWIAEQRPSLYLYEIHVHAHHRGCGHGGTAMIELEEEARRLGLNEIGLSVFEHNDGAIRLYQRLGYVTVEQGEHGRRMSKSV